MSLPALLLPRYLDADELDVEAGERVREMGERTLEPLLEEARRLRPSVGSPEEATLLRRFARATVELAGCVGSTMMELFLSGAAKAAKEIVTEESCTAEVERRFALHQLGQALEVYEDFLVGVEHALEGAGLPFEALVEHATEELDNAPDNAPIADDDAVFLRWQLSLLVALEALDGDVEELAWFASAALRAARRVRVLSWGGNVDLCSELAHIEARHSWESWDPADWDQELAPWPER